MGVVARRGALGTGCPNLRAAGRRRRGSHHGPQGRLRLERVAQLVLPGQLDEGVDEGLEQRALDVDALDGAAGLAGIEEGAIHQRRQRGRQVIALERRDAPENPEQDQTGQRRSRCWFGENSVGARYELVGRKNFFIRLSRLRRI